MRCLSTVKLCKNDTGTLERLNRLFIIVQLFFFNVRYMYMTEIVA